MTDWYDSGASGDRFVFALVLALVAHAGIILGVGFSPPDVPPPAASLDVTLTPFRSDTAPEHADFLAETNQLGGGDSARPLEASSAIASQINAMAVTEVQREAGAPGGPAPEPDPLLHSTNSPEHSAPSADPSPEQSEAPGLDEPSSASEAASLIARLREQSRAYARRPRVERVTSVSARAADDAAYLLAWTERVESIGNRNYPVEARRRRLYGDLRLMVALRPDGSVVEVRVLQSSGYPVLDQAAVRIVHLAAPFDDFPPALRERSDLLEIIRTWRFRADRMHTAE